MTRQRAMERRPSGPRGGSSRRAAVIGLGWISGSLAWGCAGARPPSAAAPDIADIAASARRSGVADRQHVALTIYNSNFALVRDQRRLSLGTGRVALAFEDVSANVQPATVFL